MFGVARRSPCDTRLLGLTKQISLPPLPRVPAPLRRTVLYCLLSTTPHPRCALRTFRRWPLSNFTAMFFLYLCGQVMFAPV